MPRLSISLVATLLTLAAAGDSQAQTARDCGTDFACISRLTSPGGWQQQPRTQADLERDMRLRQLEDQQRRQQQQLDILRGQQGPISTNPCLAQPGVWRC